MSLPKLHTKYWLTIEVLTPLHIGTGQELWYDLDYVVHGKRTWVVNQEALLETTLSEEGSFDNMLLNRPISELLRQEDFQEDSPLFRYVLPGVPAITTRHHPLREQIKDVWGNPYLPGSSIKGALRTLLLWAIFKNRKTYPNLARLGERDKYAAQGIEREVFSPGARERKEAPNKDVLRALHVGDTTPVIARDALALVTARVYPTNKTGSGVDVDVEAVQRDITFQSSLTIDLYGFEDLHALQVLGWRDKHEQRDLYSPLISLAKIGQFHAQLRVQQEKEFLERTQTAPRVLDFYRWLENQPLKKNEWFMQIGWGAGWNSKTLNDLLLGQAGFERVISQYNLARGKRKPGRPFPASRKLILRDGQPAVPMGWVKCRLERVEGGA